jgi:electron transport complex protein RnfB
MTRTLTEQLDAVLPQTQCTRCGYPDCRSYAHAIAQEGEAINRCPPGGQVGIVQLAQLTGRAALALDPDCGVEAPFQLAVIDEAWCIGCTLCIKACPVDCIVGSHKQMHTVIEAQCTGCELCLPVCPVDCISLAPATTPSWTPEQANDSRQRYETSQARRSRAAQEHAQALEAKARHKLEHLDTLTRDNTPEELDRKRSLIEAALARARARRDPST